MAELYQQTLLIDRIGHRGDGIAEGSAGPVYVPYTLAGEDVLVERAGPSGNKARVVRVDRASPERVEPCCRHFGPEAPAACGGCSLQMMSLDANRTLKRHYVADALSGQGIALDVDATIGAAPGERRRAILSARKTAAGILLGYHQRGSDQIVDIAECPVLVADISGRLAGLRSIVGALDPAGGPARLTVLAAEPGLDVDIAPEGKRTRFGSLTDESRLQSLVALCREWRIARLTVDGELAVKLADPIVRIAGVTVAAPPAAFTQPAASTEAVMSRVVSAHLSGCKSIVDLFSGIGTFTLSLARHSSVHAVEIDQGALDTLDQAFRMANGLKRITTERRDILRYPVSSAELGSYSGLVFDPPRAGARAQAEEIAASSVQRVAAISCNPATFARDCRVLLDGGMSLLNVVPIDQFVYSAETEVVGLFAR